MHKLTYIACMALIMSLVSTGAWASVDDAFSDKSEKLTQLKEVKPSEKGKGSWLPVPIPIANPTVGNGVVGALLYMHPKDSEAEPTTTSGLGGMYTDSGSWFVGLFHDDYWLNDRIRFKIAAGTGDFNLDYYSAGAGAGEEDDPLNYDISSNLSSIQLLGRLKDESNWYLGARHVYTDADVVFNIPLGKEEDVVALEGESKTSSLGFLSMYDSRNNNYYPTGGQYLELLFSKDREDWGSDYHYDKFTGFYNTYLPLTDMGTLAIRGWASSVVGDSPFYMLPTLNMRGFARGRYRDEVAMSGHLEWRHKVSERWAYVAFTEIGNAADDYREAFQGDWVTSYGAGIRWQVLASQPLNLGVDVGFSGDDKAIYLQVGERF